MGASRYTTGTSGRSGGVDSPVVRAVGSMGDWNQARDGPIGAHTEQADNEQMQQRQAFVLMGRHA